MSEVKVTYQKELYSLTAQWPNWPYEQKTESNGYTWNKYGECPGFFQAYAELKRVTKISGWSYQAGGKVFTTGNIEKPATRDKIISAFLALGFVDIVVDTEVIRRTREKL